LSLVLTIALLLRGRVRSVGRLIPSRALVLVVFVALGWGLVETLVETKRHLWASLDRDEVTAVAQRLAKLADEQPETNDAQAVVFYFDLDHADISPAIAPQRVLWSPHVPAFSGVGLDENRERIYQYLYYAGEDLTKIDAERIESLDYRRRYLVHSLIEWGHNDPAWTVNWKQISPAEIRGALRGYADYVNAFSSKQASSPTLRYVVAVTDAAHDFSNLDRWYERDAGERIGRWTLYRVHLRPENNNAER
jgi:hypothetical protein